jgi:hypothetical protein
MENKKEELPYYYTKPIRKVGDLKHGEWVYNEDAYLCYVQKDPEIGVRLHYYAIESFPHDDTIVYPLTLATKEIMDKMYEHRMKYHNAHIMNPHFSRQLEDDLYRLMLVDETNPECQKQYNEIWSELDKRFEELVGHAKALHII